MGMIYDLTPLLSRRRAPERLDDDPNAEILSRRRMDRLRLFFYSTVFQSVPYQNIGDTVESRRVNLFLFG